MPGTTSFPTSLDNNTNLDETLQDNVDEVVVAHIINAYAAIKALQTKVGITSSAVNTTFDYLRNAVLRQSGLNVDLAGTLDVTGAAVLDSTLTVAGLVTMSGAATVGTTLGVTGTLTAGSSSFATPVANSGASPSAGVATTFARSDHNHGEDTSSLSAVGAYMTAIRTGAAGQFNSVPDGVVVSGTGSGSLTGHEDWLYSASQTGTTITMLAPGSNADVTIQGNKSALQLSLPGNSSSETVYIYQDDRPINPSLGPWIMTCQFHLVESMSGGSRPLFTFGLLAATGSAPSGNPNALANGVAISIGGVDTTVQLTGDTFINVRSGSADVVDNNTAMTHIGSAGRWVTWIAYYDGTNLHVYEAIETAQATLTEVYDSAVTMPNTDLTFGAMLDVVGTVDGTVATVNIHVLNFSFLDDAGSGMEQWPNVLP